MASTIAAMSISLPKTMKEHIRRRVKESHYSTPSDYMRSLVREDMRREEQERLEQALLKGLRSKKGLAYGTGEWNAYKKRVIASVAKTKKRRP